MVTINRSTTQARDASVILGIQKHLLNVPTLALAGTTIAPADLVKLAQSHIDSANAVAAAKAKWHDAVQADAKLGKGLTPLLRALRQYLLNVYGTASSELADFGFSPPKIAVKTPEAKAAAAIKAKATRKARNTMGKVQKKSVRGTVEVPAPVTSSTGPAPISPAPAASAPVSGTSSAAVSRST